MSEFDEALAQAVEDGIARGGLPGAADALRRGRRRSLRARGGMAVLGVAAMGGSLGVSAAFGEGGKTAAAPTTKAATSPTTGHSASAPTSPAHGDGLLAADLWPGHDLVHWEAKLNNPRGPVKAVGSLVMHCYPSNVNPPMLKTFPVTGMNMWTNGYDTTHHADGIYSVYTFADEAEASAFLADARHAPDRDPGCGSGPGAVKSAPGVSTDYGLSWLTLQQDSGVRHLPSDTHDFVVQSGNRVALLTVNQFGTAFTDTTDDLKVLADMRQALEK